jgi:predicted HNH restriction endonuclease
MKKSIITDDMTHCYNCGSTYGIQMHHAIYGSANRKLADEDGLIVPLCHACHDSLHRLNPKLAYSIRQVAQKAWEAVYGGREAFLKRYGRSWMGDGKWD